MATKKISITLPQGVLKSLDIAAEEANESRSGYIRGAVEMRVQMEKYIKSQVTEPDSNFNILGMLHRQMVSNRKFHKKMPRYYQRYTD